MMTFEPFWRKMNELGISTYDLEYEYGFNPAEISRLKNNHNFTIRYINRLCAMFDLKPEDIMEYVETSEDVRYAP